MITGADTNIIKLNVPNLSADLTAKIQALECADAVTQESPTELKVLVHGNEAFDNIIDAIRKSGGKISSMENLQPTLEDVFLHITGHHVRDSATEKIPMEHKRFGQQTSNRIR
jgi:ABC-2 type transport system ATP-binding protein